MSRVSAPRRPPPNHLCSCDYCDTIRGIGPTKAYELIKVCGPPSHLGAGRVLSAGWQAHGSIEKVLEVLDTKKFPVPEDWPFVEARKLFVSPEVTPAEEVTLKWSKPDVEGLVEFMCKKNGFQEDRIRSGAKKLEGAFSGPTQGRMDSFFKMLPPTGPSKVAAKRKAEAAAAKGKKAKSKGGFGGGFKKKK